MEEDHTVELLNKVRLLFLDVNGHFRIANSLTILSVIVIVILISGLRHHQFFAVRSSPVPSVQEGSNVKRPTSKRGNNEFPACSRLNFTVMYNS